MNDIIGIAGGSTSNANGALCDNDAQSATMPADKAKELPSPAFSKSGCGSGTSPANIQLAFGVYDGPATETKAIDNTPALDSNCKEIQNFCGGCSSDLATCISANPAEYNETVSSATVVDYYSKNAHAATTKAACETGFFLDPENCIFCDMFKSIFNAASTIAKAANEGLATPTRTLVGIGFLIWLAIFVLRNVSSFGATKMSDLLKGLLVQGFRVTVVMLILGGAIYQVMDLTVSPILQTGLSFARTVVADGQSTCSADAEYLQGVVGYDANKGFEKTSEGGLSKQLGISYLCSIKKLEDSVSKLVSYGQHSNCLAFKDFPMLGFIPHMGFLTTGVFLYIVGAVLLIVFPWFLIDCLLQICIVVALLPCAIGAYAFKITEKYLKHLWSFFMNSMFNFVFISIIVFIISANFKTWLGYDFDSNEIDPNIFINATGNGLAWWGTTAFRLLGIVFFCYIFLSEAKGMAQKFADAPALGRGKGIGTLFGGLAASAGFSLGKAGLGTGIKAGESALDSLGATGGKIADAVNESFTSIVGAETESASNHAKALYLRASGGKAVYDKNGNVTGYYKKLRYGEKEYTKDDKGVWSSRITKGNTETIDDTILKPQLTKNEKGEFIGINTQAKTVSSKYLINNDNTINQHAVDTLISNSGNKEYAARHIVSEVMKERGMQLDDTFLSSKTQINDDGSFTIIQKNEDGKLQTVNASINRDTGVMTIKSEINDGSGDISTTTSDGINAPRQASAKQTTGATSALNTNRAGATGGNPASASTESSSSASQEQSDGKDKKDSDDKNEKDDNTSESSGASRIKSQHKDKLSDLLTRGKLSEDEMNDIVERLNNGMTDAEFEQIIREFEGAEK